jgi:hypothetical protein
MAACHAEGLVQPARFETALGPAPPLVLPGGRGDRGGGQMKRTVVVVGLVVVLLVVGVLLYLWLRPTPVHSAGRLGHSTWLSARQAMVRPERLTWQA